MNKLKGQICYGAGFIDESPGVAARGWREDMGKFLNNLGIGFFNPCDKPITNAKIDEDENFVAKINNLKDIGEYDQVKFEMQEIVRQDLKLVDLSNFVILCIDRDLHMCGSYTEFTYACMQRKPVLVYCKQGKSKIPNWVWGLGDHSYFFGDWESLKQKIVSINDGSDTDDMDGKWRFFDMKKVFGNNE